MVPVPGKGGRAACLRSGSCYDRPEQPQRQGIYAAAAAAARRLISASPAPYSPRRGGGTEPVPALRLAARLKGNGGGRREGRDSGGSECRDAFPSSRSSCPTIILTHQPLESLQQQQATFQQFALIPKGTLLHCLLRQMDDNQPPSLVILKRPCKTAKSVLSSPCFRRQHGNFVKLVLVGSFGLQFPSAHAG
uniref:SH3 domain-binding glutamic acid-rich-like protein isoform X2 n=1 Tax=Podarcis muralis TaxID=64176 RepID=UPI00109F9A7F|nr:SH3 domain-binding glutamic acid-rich-like protein isoform X2 [Podarcis muralis]